MNERDVLVICTKDRPDDIAGCLRSLLLCDDLPDEVWIVDSSASNATAMSAELLRSEFGRADSKLVYWTCTPGLTTQRNFALDRVAPDFEFVHFIDDDSLVIPSYFPALRDVFSQHPQCAGAGAFVVASTPTGELRSGFTRRQRSRTAAFLSKAFLGLFDMRAEPGAFTKSGVSGTLYLEPDFVSGSPGLSRRVSWLSGCSMSFRLGVIDGLRFDEDGLRGYALGEDLEFCVQAARRGELWIAAGTYMRHVGSPTNRLQARRMSKMSMVNRAYFVRKHPDEFEKRAYWKTFLGMTLLSAMRMQWSAVGGLFDGVKIVVREGSRLNDSQHD